MVVINAIRRSLLSGTAAGTAMDELTLRSLPCGRKSST